MKKFESIKICFLKNCKLISLAAILLCAAILQFGRASLIIIPVFFILTYIFHRDLKKRESRTHCQHPPCGKLIEISEGKEIKGKTNAEPSKYVCKKCYGYLMHTPVKKASV